MCFKVHILISSPDKSLQDRTICSFAGLGYNENVSGDFFAFYTHVQYHQCSTTVSNIALAMCTADLLLSGYVVQQRIFKTINKFKFERVK